jgi:hypothetical protein
VTADPNAKEIKDALLPGQTSKDRPDLIARVFREKVRILLKFIDEGCFGKCRGQVYTIEFQKRGLPHIHILIFLHPDARLEEPHQIDKAISAQLPDPVTHPKLFQLVEKLMIHGPCGELNSNLACMKDGKCSKNYPKTFQEQSVLSENGYTLYAHPQNGRTCIKKVNGVDVILDNRWVVPYNPLLLTQRALAMACEVHMPLWHVSWHVDFFVSLHRLKSRKFVLIFHQMSNVRSQIRPIYR